MKGIILAGGTGSRLFPTTKVINKHLLPVHNRPMIEFPIETLKNSGIRDILIVTSQHNAGDFMRLLGSGSDYGVNFTYKIQDGAGGIAQALSLAENFVAGQPVAVLLGDNIFEDDFAEAVLRFRGGAHIFLKKVDDPERFGVVEVNLDGSVESIIEKPAIPKSNLAQTGFYLYDGEVFDLIREIEPSQRGELEITDLNQKYLKNGKLYATEIFGMWLDAGTHDSLLEASILAQEAFDEHRIKQRRQQKALRHSESIIPKVTVGIVTHNSEKYLEPCLESILKQSYQNIEIKIFDNHSTDKTRQISAENYPEIEIIESKKNVGFSRAHNEILRQTDSDFYACINPDMLLEANFISEMVHAIEHKASFGAAGGKLKRWDFQSYLAGDSSSGKTNFIDSIGLKILRSHRFEDAGQGEVDFGQYDGEQKVFGISGAAVLYRRKALEDVSFQAHKDAPREYFDESMFMYKEDIDLAYRLQWAGWKAAYTSKAVAYHDRTATLNGQGTWQVIKNRFKKSSSINRTSFLNHKILLEKNYSSLFSSGTRSATFWYNLKTFLFVLIFETELLGSWWKVFRMRKRLNQWKKTMPRRVSQSDIEAYMQG